jgi:hypothetical protein
MTQLTEEAMDLDQFDAQCPFDNDFAASSCKPNTTPDYIFLEEGKDTAMVVEGRWALIVEVASAHVAKDSAQFAEPGQLNNNVALDVEQSTQELYANSAIELEEEKYSVIAMTEGGILPKNQLQNN